MKELYPNITLNVEANTNDEVINKVLKNKTNLGFIDKNITHKDLVVHNYVNDNIVAVCSINSKYATKQFFTLEELSKLNL